MTVGLLFIFINAAIINNFVFKYFLGLCPFLGVSRQMNTAVGMGSSVTFVMIVAGTLTWLIYNLLLVKLGIEFLQYVVFILVIAGTVQLVEMYLCKFSPGLYAKLGTFLPMITTNCAILGACLFIQKWQYTFIEAFVFTVGAGLGFTLAMVIMAGIREELDYAEVPGPFRGPAITLIIASIVAIAFSGFLIRR